MRIVGSCSFRDCVWCGHQAIGATGDREQELGARGRTFEFDYAALALTQGGPVPAPFRPSSAPKALVIDAIVASGGRKTIGHPLAAGLRRQRKVDPFSLAFIGAELPDHHAPRRIRRPAGVFVHRQFRPADDDVSAR